MEEIKTTKTGRHILYLDDTREDLKTLSRRDIIRDHRCGTRACVIGSMDNFSCYITQYRVAVIGDKIFWQKTAEEKLIFKSGKFYGIINNDILCLLLKVFHLDWIKNNLWTRSILSTNKTLWSMVFRGKITSPESLAKKYSKLYFKGAYSYRNIKEYYTVARCRMGSLWDIYYYTTNPNMYVDNFLHGYYSGAQMEIAFDMLEYCKIENAKLNPDWSFKRMQAEHQAQIEREHLEEINKMSDEPIAPAFSRDGLSLLLDERSTYIEGCAMHNCVHSCYWRRIKSGEYLIASGVVNGTKIDLGISIYVYSDPQLGPIPHFELSQVHSIYNGSVSDEIHDKCRQWIRENTKALMDTVHQIKTKQLAKAKASDCRPLHEINALEELRRALRREEDIDLPF